MAVREADILWEDQQRINRFSILNMDWHDLEKEVKLREEKLHALQDAADEIELLIGDSVKCLIGESFVELTNDEVLARLERLKAADRVETEGLRGKMEEMEREMKTLKAHLYAKFGSRINLEED
jgi:prefoldin subunit 4